MVVTGESVNQIPKCSVTDAFKGGGGKTASVSGKAFREFQGEPVRLFLGRGKLPVFPSRRLLHSGVTAPESPGWALVSVK